MKRHITAKQTVAVIVFIVTAILQGSDIRSAETKQSQLAIAEDKAGKAGSSSANPSQNDANRTKAGKSAPKNTSAGADKTAGSDVPASPTKPAGEQPLSDTNQSSEAVSAGTPEPQVMDFGPVNTQPTYPLARMPWIEEIPAARTESELSGQFRHIPTAPTVGALEYVFRGPAQFPLPAYGPYGEPAWEEGTIIHEGMTFRWFADGRYEVRFAIETAGVPITLRLQFLFFHPESGQIRTVTLPRISIPDRGDEGRAHAAVYTVHHEGYAPALAAVRAAIFCSNEPAPPLRDLDWRGIPAGSSLVLYGR